MEIAELLVSPEAWLALVTLIVLEVVLGVDNLIFISILTNKLPEQHRSKARKIGLSGALLMRLVLLSMVAWIVTLTDPVFELFDHGFSWKDLILIAGGLFLVWKATREIHHNVDPDEGPDDILGQSAVAGIGTAIFQILLLDLVFSIDSIITAVGMTPHLPIMYTAVIIAVGVMMLAAGPLAEFIEANPTIVMLALGFLLMIGMVLIADGFGVNVPRGYVYTAMAFSAFIEVLNMLARRRRKRQRGTTNAGAIAGDEHETDRQQL